MSERTKEDQALREMMRGLDPNPEQIERMERVLAQRLTCDEPTMSLWAEWIELLRIKPLSTPALAFAGCAGMVLLSPLSGLLMAILGG
jgi:hypothetical protein